MRRFFLMVTALTLSCGAAIAQTANGASGVDENGAIQKYRRSSLYSVLIKHSTFPYGEAIDSAFMAMPTPDKFNNHDAGPKSFESSAVKMKKKGDQKVLTNTADIEQFILSNHIPHQMVAKWFNRNTDNGAFNLDLMIERGLYDAQQVDIKAAKASSRNIMSLGDAGEELIGKTFLLVNDITFVDQGERTQKAAGWLKAVGQVAGAVTGSSGLSTLGNVAGSAVNEFDGFTVNITSYLYRLDWSPEVAETFWSEYWIDQDNLDNAKRAAFDDSGLFKLSYVGETTTSAANVSSKSFSNKSKADQMLKVCTRAVDKSIVELQREYDEFKVNVPIGNINADSKTVEVAIGLKEGINEKSQFDVLMKVQNEDGSYTYDKVGKLQPIKGQIWDNRFGALEEAQALAEDGKSADKEGNPMLTATTFKILDGANRIVPGCLVREVTIKRTK